MSDDPKPALNPDARPIPGGEDPAEMPPQVFRRGPFTGLGQYVNLPPDPQLGVTEPGRPITGTDPRAKPK